MDIDDLASSVDIRQREVELSVEPTGATQGGVDRVGTIRRTDDDDLSSAVHAVHQREQGRNNRSMDLLLLAAADRRQTCSSRGSVSGSSILQRESLAGFTVDLVKEDDGRLARASLVEEQSELSFGFSNPFRQAVGTLAHEESWKQETAVSISATALRQATSAHRSCVLRYCNWQREHAPATSFRFREGRGTRHLAAA